jgi:hypothetical protein
MSVGLLCALMLTASARAELRVLDSVEWMTDDSQLILRGKVVAIKGLDLPGDSGFRDITIEVHETLQGKSPGMRMVIRSWPGEIKEGNEFLFFLKRGHDVYGPKDYRRPIVGNRWTQRIFWNGNAYGAINLDQPSDEVVTADFRLLSKREQILQAVKQRIESTRRKPRVVKPAEKDPPTKVWLPPVGVVRWDMPADCDAFQKLWAGSAVWVYIPTDEELLPKILQQLQQHGNQRDPALVAALASYPNPMTEKFLRELLQDKSISTTFGQDGKVIRITYPVRAAAYAALLRLGVRVPQPVLEKKQGE